MKDSVKNKLDGVRIVSATHSDLKAVVKSDKAILDNVTIVFATEPPEYDLEGFKMNSTEEI